MRRERFRPFTGDAASRVNLEKNALALVLCQVRWPDLRNLRDTEQLAALVRSLDEAFADYPEVREGRELAFNITPVGVAPVPGEQMHEWLSGDGAWIATLSKHSFSLSCIRGYTRFEEFTERLQPLLDSVLAEVRPSRLERVGVRYVNRFLEDDVLANPAAMFRGFGQPLTAADDSVRLLNATQQCTYGIDDLLLQVRSGYVPPEQTVDPMIPSVAGDSWVLDLDSFKQDAAVADPGTVMAVVQKLADINYDYFKHAVTDAFLELHGGGGA